MTRRNDFFFPALAQSAVHRPTVSALIPRSYLDEAFYSNAVFAVISGVSTLLRDATPKTFAPAVPRSRDSEVSAFDVLALVLKDENLAATSTGASESEPSLPLVLKTVSGTIRR